MLQQLADVEDVVAAVVELRGALVQIVDVVVRCQDVERLDQLGADLQRLVKVLDLARNGDDQLLAQLLQAAQHPQLGVATLQLDARALVLKLILHDRVEVQVELQLAVVAVGQYVLSMVVTDVRGVGEVVGLLEQLLERHRQLLAQVHALGAHMLPEVGIVHHATARPAHGRGQVLLRLPEIVIQEIEVRVGVVIPLVVALVVVHLVLVPLDEVYNALYCRVYALVLVVRVAGLLVEGHVLGRIEDAVLDHEVDEVHGPSYLAEDGVAVLLHDHTVAVDQAVLRGR